MRWHLASMVHSLQFTPAFPRNRHIQRLDDFVVSLFVSIHIVTYTSSIRYSLCRIGLPLINYLRRVADDLVRLILDHSSDENSEIYTYLKQNLRRQIRTRDKTLVTPSHGNILTFEVHHDQTFMQKNPWPIPGPKTTQSLFIRQGTGF